LGVTAVSGKKSQAERALRELRALILGGDLPPGGHVSETAAADLIGISRTPMREAMAQLVDEGLLDRAPTGRCTVRSFSREDIIDAIEFRGVLEGTVVRIAAERGADMARLTACRAVIDAIDAVLGSTEDDVDFDGYTRLNEDFHDHLARLSGSATLERELMRAYRLPLASPNAFLQSQANVPAVRRSLFIAQAQHKAIIEAVAQREGARAEALAREHARLARANLDHVIRDHQGLAGAIPGLSLVSHPTVDKTNTTSHPGRTS
jgi:GntR family transcriptional regulator of vanillate catabolism